MKQITLPYGTFYAKETDTHLHGVSIQSLVEHFGAILEGVAFAPGQKAHWRIDGKSVEVEIIKQCDVVTGYWNVIGQDGVLKLAHETDLDLVEEATV